MTDASMMEMLSGALKELYAPADPHSLRQRAAHLVRTLIPAEVVRYAELRADGEGFENEYCTSRREEFERFRPFFNAHIDEHPVVNYYRSHRESRVLRISDLVAPRAFKKTAIYNEFYRRIGIDHQLTTALFSREGRCREIILDREKKDFTRKEVYILEMFTPHLDQAFAGSAYRNILQYENKRLKDSLESTGEGFLLVDTHARIIYRSSKADDLMAGCCEYNERSPGRLSPRLNAFLDRMIFRHANPLSASSRDSRLILKHSRGRVIVRFAALPNTAGSPREYLLILKETPVQNGCQPLRSLGLTHRQAEILQLIARGNADAEIGNTLGISPRTVEKHLENIYAKLRVDNRVDASRRAFEVLYAGQQ